MTKRISLALDGLSLEQSITLCQQVGGRVREAKIHNLFDKHGPSVVRQLRDAGASDVWIDAKIFDIPKTAEARAKAIAESGASVITVHAIGGVEMMRAAVKGAGPNVKILAITVLTSIEEYEVPLLFGLPAKAAVLNLARLAKLAGVYGVVSSVQEVGMLASRPELKGLVFVVPGTRSAGKALGDQKRSGTPGAAITDGATVVVAGSQVTAAVDPVAAFDEMEEEVEMAAKEKEAA